MKAFLNEFGMPLILFYPYIILTSEHFVHNVVKMYGKCGKAWEDRWKTKKHRTLSLTDWTGLCCVILHSQMNTDECLFKKTFRFFISYPYLVYPTFYTGSGCAWFISCLSLSILLDKAFYLKRLAFTIILEKNMTMCRLAVGYECMALILLQSNAIKLSTAFGSNFDWQ